MEITESLHTQIVFPGLIVSFVLVFAVLVFVFGFKSVEDFPFDKLATANDNRKPAGKKRKAKDKKGQPGQISSVVENKQNKVDNEKYVSNTSKSKATEKTLAKEPPKTNISKDEKQSTKQAVSTGHNTPLKETKTNKAIDKQAKTEIKEKYNKTTSVNKKTQNKGKENVNIQNKKNQENSTNKSKLDDKQNDDDGGEWEQAFSRKDKKTKKTPLIEDEPQTVEKLTKSDGKKKKTGNQNEPVNIVAESEPQVAPSIPTPAPIPPTPSATPSPAPAPQQQPDQEVTTKVATKKNKEQKKDSPKTLKEDSNKKIVEQTSGQKEKISPKEVSDSTKFIENEKENTAEVILSEIKSPKETQVKDLTDQSTPVFDELGDTWQEAKAAKKQSKKKVRKAE